MNTIYARRSAARGEKLGSRLTLILIGGAGIIASPARADLIVNGSFESPTLHTDPAFVGVAATGWATSGGALVRDGGPLFPYIGPSPEDGARSSLIGTGGNWLQQMFSVPSDGNYELTWFDNTLLPGSAAPGPTDYKVFVYNSSNVAVADADSGQFFGSASWNARSLEMTLGAGDYRLYFSNAGTSAPFYYALDKVSLEPVVAAHGVPDGGSTFALGGISAAFIGLIRRCVR